MPDEETNPASILRSIGMLPTSAPERISGGMDTAIWRFVTADGEAHALRLFRDGQQAQAGREVVAMEAARERGMPVPAIEARGEWDGRPVTILQWAAGQPILRQLERRPWLLFSLGRRLGEAQAALHAHAPPPALLEGAPGYWLGRPGAEHHALIADLGAAGVGTDTFVHMDFHPLNVLSEDGQVTAIIDWVGAAAGDRRADVALTMTILNAAPIPPGPLRPLMRVARGLLARSWRRGYESIAGKLDDRDLAPFLAWAGATMLHEMEPRARAGGAWPTPDDLEPIRRWRDSWRERAGGG